MMDSGTLLICAGVLFVVFLVCVAGFGKLLLHLYDSRAIERHNRLEEAHQREANRLAELKRHVDALSQTLPLEYVRREDWIRFGASIDAKLDRLAQLLDESRGGRNRGA